MGNAPAARFRVTRTHVWLGLPVFIVLWKNLQFPLPLVDLVASQNGGSHRWHRFDTRYRPVFVTALGKPFVLQN
jgi:hypothetical protein